MIDATIVVNNDYSTVVVYVKFLRFLIWSVVKGNPTIGKNISIKFSSNQLILPQSVNDKFMGSFLHSRIKMIDDSPKISPEQEKKL